MEELPDALVQYILSLMNNAKDVASCNCVSKRWKDSTPYLRSLFFPRNLFDNLPNGFTPDEIVGHMVSTMDKLEELVVYCSFTGMGLMDWLSKAGSSLKSLELRLDNMIEHHTVTELPSKLDCIRLAPDLESLKLWGVIMLHLPKWDDFNRLKNLEIVGARLEEKALSNALNSCPNLTHLLLLGCEGLQSVTINNPYLQECKLDFFGAGNCFLTITSSKIEYLEVQGCSLIRVLGTQFMKNLSISNNQGRVYLVECGELAALETLIIRGIQWSWDAISNLLQLANNVKHLFMKVEFTGNTEDLLPFPEVDIVEFFNRHLKLQTFDIHGAMFASLCQKNSLKNVNSRFSIPCLEKVVVTVRSPLNAEQKMGTLESLLKYSKNLKKLTIKILQMKSSHSSADEFFEEICKFQFMNRKIVALE